MAKIKHLIFDMGNVLMRYDPEVPLREYVSSEEARDLIRKELFQGPEWVERDRGTISIEEMCVWLGYLYGTTGEIGKIV